MRVSAFLLCILFFVTGCVTVSKEYISKVPVEKQVEVPIVETVTKVKYEQQNLFGQKPGTVEIALVKTKEFSTNTDAIVSQIFDHLTTVPDLNDKFVIYDSNTLKQLLNLNSIDVTIENDLKVLKKNQMDYVMYISDIGPLGDRFTLNIVDLLHNESAASIKFRNSYDSSFLNDLRFFFLQQEIPVYYEEEVVTGTTYKTVTELVERTITHDYKTMPWGGRILLTASIVGILYVLSTQ